MSKVLGLQNLKTDKNVVAAVSSLSANCKTSSQQSNQYCIV